MTAWPGKTFSRPADEPESAVGLWLLPPTTRQPMARLRRFIRLATAIAESESRPATERLARLESLDGMLLAGAAAEPQDDAMLIAALVLRDALTGCGVSLEHPRQLLQACQKQIMTPRCRSWSDLLLYCRFGAAPLGRCMLELHDEDQAAAGAADALCNAYEVLSRLQRCVPEYRQRRRLTIPEDWLRQAGGTEKDLLSDRTSSALRATFDRVLDRVAELLLTASLLPGQLRDPGLKREAAVALVRAEAWATNLRRTEPADYPPTTVRNAAITFRGLWLSF